MTASFNLTRTVRIAAMISFKRLPSMCPKTACCFKVERMRSRCSFVFGSAGRSTSKAECHRADASSSEFSAATA